MRVLSLVLLAGQAAAVINWTLHASCYDGNPKMEAAVVKAVKEAKRLAAQAAEKLDQSEVSIGIQLLINGKNTEMRNGFESLAQIADEPIGAKSSGERYWKSADWEALATSDLHYRNFVITCSPPTIERTVNGQTEDYDQIRLVDIDGGSLNNYLIWLEEKKNWEDLSGQISKAEVCRDKDVPNMLSGGGRTRVPETVNLNPLFMNYLRDKKDFTYWEPGFLDKLEGPEAHRDLQEESARAGLDIRPLDSVIAEHLPLTLVHEFFHLSAFGRWFDEPKGAAWDWADCVRYQNLQNPQQYAFAAAIVELASLEGTKYTVTKDGGLES